MRNSNFYEIWEYNRPIVHIPCVITTKFSGFTGDNVMLFMFLTWSVSLKEYRIIDGDFNSSGAFPQEFSGEPDNETNKLLTADPKMSKRYKMRIFAITVVSLLELGHSMAPGG